MLGGLASESAVPLGVLMTGSSICSILAFRSARRSIAADPELEAAFMVVKPATSMSRPQQAQ